MRNLSVTAKSRTHLPAGQHASIAAFDIDENCLIVTSLIREPEPAVLLHKLNSSHVQDTLPKYKPTIPITNPSVPLILSVKVLAESHTLVLILHNGEIATLPLDDITNPDCEFETVGEVESGLRAASWSPDESLLVLITGEDNIILMTSSFETVSERPMKTAEDGEETSVNVGWGSKATQFHGSLGKAAAKEGTTSTHEIGSSGDDDGLPHVSWKGDGSTFVVSSLESSGPPITPTSTAATSTSVSTPTHRRVLRYYSKTLTYLHPAEAIAGLEHSLAWRPSGSLVASTQRFSPTIPGLGKGKEGRHDIVFFEPNGLRHGEFALRGERWWKKDPTDPKSMVWGYHVKQLLWNTDSTILAVWISVDDSKDVVQLWTASNYHWFLRQEIRSEDSTGFSTIMWHPEDAVTLVTISDSYVSQYSFVWDTCISRVQPPLDAAYAAVIDGNNLNLTPFRLQNVPPPMCTFPLALPKSRGPPVSVAFSQNDDTVVALWVDGYFQFYELQTSFEKGKEKPLSPRLMWQGFGDEKESRNGSCREVLLWRQSSEAPDWNVSVLRSSETDNNGSSCDEAHLVTISGDKVTSSRTCELGVLNGILIPSTDGANDEKLYWQSREGDILQVSLAIDDTPAVPAPLSRFPVHCYRAERHQGLFVGLSNTGDLYVAAIESEPRLIASKCNSFVISLGILVFTTAIHQAFFAPLDSIREIISAGTDSTFPEWEQRRVERGSRIVTAVDSNMSLVLQMPRGNLETVYPRPLVVRHVKRNVDRGNYRDAFIDCRKHRIDLNLLVDHDHTSFMANIPTFIEQVHEVDYINLFLAGIGRAKQSPEEISLVCDAIRSELEQKDLKKYVNSILTTHVVKAPPDYESALSILLQLHKEDPSLVESAVKYIIFLADANLLFDTALGMYDFALVLMIAQQSQKDPREYLPFLRGLRSLESNYQKFKIDEHLKRYVKALGHIHLTGDDHFEEAKSFIEKHRMYIQALNIWEADSEKRKELYDLYGDYLFERREFEEAAIAFRLASRLPKASIAHERALQWREVFEIAHAEDLPHEDMEILAERIADQLALKRHYADASQVAMEYIEDVEVSIRYLAEGSLFSEAKRLACKHSRSDLLEGIVIPAILNARISMSEEIEEIREQFEKQLTRIRDLRERKEAEPDAFYGIEENLHNVDVMTDVSTPFTAFTRYTTAPSTVSRGTSKRSQKLKRRSERKAGRKGTVEEEEYLLTSLTKLVGRFRNLQDDCRRLLPHLLTCEGHEGEATELQKEMFEFETTFGKGIDEIWASPERSHEAQKEEAVPTFIGMQTLERKVDPREKHPKPNVAESRWSYSILSSTY